MIEPLQEKQQRLLKSLKNISYIREAFRYIDNQEKMVGIIGSRGVGKTTLLLQYINQFEPDEVLYFSADDLLVLNYGIYDIVDEFYSLGGRVVAIDEVHRFKNWSQHLKNIYDSFPDLTIRISGSSMLNILYEKYDLSRRLVLHTLPVLSFREYLQIVKDITFKSYTLEEILKDGVKLSKEFIFKHEDLYGHFKEYMKYGAYPFFLEGSRSFDQKLYNALEKIIHEDIPSLNKIDYSHISTFEKLIYFVVSSNKPFSVNVASLSREFGVSEPTLYTYFDILDKTAIFKSMRKKSVKISKKPQKLLFANTNILSAYSNKINLDLDVGVLRETFFVNCFENIFYSDIGDFQVDDYIFEVGGKNKVLSSLKILKIAS